MKKEQLQSKLVKILLHYWPVFILLAVWFAFASPYFLRGKVPFSSTYQTTFFAPWSAYPHNGMPVKNGAMPDVIGQIYPWKHLVIDIWKTGEIPLWNPYSFAGTPLLANYQSAVLSPFNLLFFFMPFVDGWSMLVLLQPLLAGFFIYLFARRIEQSKAGGLISAISFMFCGFIVTWMGYATLSYALLFLPLGLYAIESYFLTGKTRFLLLLSGVVPLSFFSGHFQISIYVAVVLFAYLLIRGRQNSWKIRILAILALLIGIFFSLPQLLPSFEFYTQSLRSGLYQKIESIPWQYMPTLIAPDFFGNPVTRNDWYGHYAEWNGYIGTFALFLTFLGLRAWKKSPVNFFGIVGVISLLLAFPSPLQDALILFHVPVLATSALSRIISVYCLTAAILAGFGFDHLLEIVQKKEKKSFLTWTGGIFVVFVTLWGVVMGKLWLPLDKINIAKQNLILPTLITLIGIGIIIIAFLSPRNYRKWVVIVGILTLVSIDMLRFATKWQPFDPKELVFAKNGVVQKFEQLSGYNRALGNYMAEVSNYYHLPGIEGYDALYPKRYGEFIAAVSRGKLGESARSVVNFPRNGSEAKQAINLLNITYVVHKVSDDNMGWTFPYWQYPSDQFVQIFNDSTYRIYKNTKALPHAFLVGSYVVEKNDQKILDTIFAMDLDLRDKIVLEQDPAFRIAKDPSASATINKYTSSDIIIQTKTTAPMALFLSDSFYPGWRASIDGQETKIFRADYAFRTVFVPKGNHVVHFWYFPNSFVIGVGGFGLGIFLYVGIYFFQKRKD